MEYYISGKRVFTLKQGCDFNRMFTKCQHMSCLQDTLQWCQLSVMASWLFVQQLAPVTGGFCHKGSNGKCAFMSCYYHNMAVCWQLTHSSYDEQRDIFVLSTGHSEFFYNIVPYCIKQTAIIIARNRAPFNLTKGTPDIFRSNPWQLIVNILEKKLPCHNGPQL